MLEAYSNLVLAVVDDEDSDPLWHKFYRIQMANYLLGQEQLKFELESVLNVYDIIHKTWLDLKKALDVSPFPLRNPDELFSQMDLNFPADEYTLSSQIDTKNIIEKVAGSF